ncbi:hypothetical protein M501DRAFT_166949 [Patellaria atrata CBS 101060]|uniref:Uncharacterized protein n=1 Tax=Patellaria atrata CBS 101060 TaxID=1346257 RepID=A0A9P4S7C0_9PEZI|nr:hypothetical protein M501DRAFT_166949 [Patellaria atrata CBS 101060]
MGNITMHLAFMVFGICGTAIYHGKSPIPVIAVTILHIHHRLASFLASLLIVLTVVALLILVSSSQNATFDVIKRLTIQLYDAILPVPPSSSSEVKCTLPLVPAAFTLSPIIFVDTNPVYPGNFNNEVHITSVLSGGQEQPIDVALGTTQAKPRYKDAEVQTDEDALGTALNDAPYKDAEVQMDEIPLVAKLSNVSTSTNNSTTEQLRSFSERSSAISTPDRFECVPSTDSTTAVEILPSSGSDKSTTSIVVNMFGAATQTSSKKLNTPLKRNALKNGMTVSPASSSASDSVKLVKGLMENSNNERDRVEDLTRKVANLKVKSTPVASREATPEAPAPKKIHSTGLDSEISKGPSTGNVFAGTVFNIPGLPPKFDFNDLVSSQVPEDTKPSAPVGFGTSSNTVASGSGSVTGVQSGSSGFNLRTSGPSSGVPATNTKMSLGGFDTVLKANVRGLFGSNTGVASNRRPKNSLFVDLKKTAPSNGTCTTSNPFASSMATKAPRNGLFASDSQFTGSGASTSGTTTPKAPSTSFGQFVTLTTDACTSSKNAPTTVAKEGDATKAPFLNTPGTGLGLFGSTPFTGPFTSLNETLSTTAAKKPGTTKISNINAPRTGLGLFGTPNTGASSVLKIASPNTVAKEADTSKAPVLNAPQTGLGLFGAAPKTGIVSLKEALSNRVPKNPDSTMTPGRSSLFNFPPSAPNVFAVSSRLFSASNSGTSDVQMSGTANYSATAQAPTNELPPAVKADLASLQGLEVPIRGNIAEKVPSNSIPTQWQVGPQNLAPIQEPCDENGIPLSIQRRPAIESMPPAYNSAVGLFGSVNPGLESDRAIHDQVMAESSFNEHDSEGEGFSDLEEPSDADEESDADIDMADHDDDAPDADANSEDFEDLGTDLGSHNNYGFSDIDDGESDHGKSDYSEVDDDEVHFLADLFECSTPSYSSPPRNADNNGPSAIDPIPGGALNRGNNQPSEDFKGEMQGFCDDTLLDYPQSSGGCPGPVDPLVTGTSSSNDPLLHGNIFNPAPLSSMFRSLDGGASSGIPPGWFSNLIPSGYNNQSNVSQPDPVDSTSASSPIGYIDEEADLQGMMDMVHNIDQARNWPPAYCDDEL